MSTVTFDVLARDHASATFRRVAGETQGLTRSLDGLRAMTRRVIGAFVALEIGRQVIDFGKESVKAYSDAQQAQARLTDAYKRFPALANVQIDALRRMNEQLQARTGADHNAIASGQAVLAQFNLTGRAIKTLTPLLVDYAAKTGQDVPTAASGLGRALLGNTRALKTVGINFKATGNQANDAATLTQLLRDKLGGFAEREGKTAAGQAKILSASFRDLEEKVGHGLYRAFSALLPTLNKLTDTVGHAAGPAFGKLASFISDRIRPALPVLANLFQNHVLPAVRAFATYVKTDMLPVLKGIGDFVARHVIPVFAKLQGGVLDGLRSAFHSVTSAISSNHGNLKTLFSTLRTVAGFILDKVAPVIGTVLRIAITVVGKEMGLWIRIIGAVVNAARHVVSFFTGPFLRGVGSTVASVVRGFKFLADVWFNVVGAIIHGAAAAFGWVPGVGGKLKQAASKFDIFRSDVDASLTGLANDAGGLGQQAGSSFLSGFFAPFNNIPNTFKKFFGLKGFDTGSGTFGSGAGGKSHGGASNPYSYDPNALAPASTDAGKKAGTSVAKGLSSATSTVVSAAKSLVDKINQQFKTLKDSARQLAQSIADTMRATVDLTQISQTDSLGAAFAPTIASIKSYLQGVVRGDRQFKNLLKSEHARGLSTALFKALGLAGPQAAGGIVQALAGASGRDLRQISGLSAQAGRIGLNLGRSVSEDVYGARLREAHHDAREANRLLAKLVAATKGNHLSSHDIRALGKEYDDALRHLRITTDTGKQDHKQGQRVLAG